jgi:benzaldehyde dehydrogenase (NAD)
MNARDNTPSWSGRILNNGWSEAQGGVMNVIEPATGAVLGSIGVADESDVDAAARSAAHAQAAWSATPFDKRAAVLREAAQLLKGRMEEFIRWDVREAGSIEPKAQWEVACTIEQLHTAAGLAQLPFGEMFPSNMPGRTNYLRRVPVGVVGVIAPWNFPAGAGAGQRGAAEAGRADQRDRRRPDRPVAGRCRLARGRAAGAARRR